MFLHCWTSYAKVAPLIQAPAKSLSGARPDWCQTNTPRATAQKPSDRFEVFKDALLEGPHSVLEETQGLSYVMLLAGLKQITDADHRQHPATSKDV